jgi:hypothetical protein
VEKSAGKFLACLDFWDPDDMLYTDYLPKGQTINLSLLMLANERNF